MRRALITAALCLIAAPAQAQLAREFSVTVAPNYRSFSMSEELAATAASLALVPVAVVVPLGSRFTVDAYAAYARGSVEGPTGTLELSGPVDTQLRGTWAATPWARVTLGVNVPTGNGSHSLEEAQVAAVLATDLLGFREASFGVGTAITTGVAAAHQIGVWGIGYGASYRVSGEFEPTQSDDFAYSPGNELVARVAVDRNLGAASKLTVGGTFQHFADDEIGESNLFRPGARVRADASYAFRAGSTTTVTVYAADMWRQQGEVSLLTEAGEETTEVGAQNTIMLGALANLGGRLRLSPRADLRLLSHEEGAGSGWVMGAGSGVDIGVAGVELTPRARVMFGSMEAQTGDSHGFTGFEIELAARF